VKRIDSIEAGENDSRLTLECAEVIRLLKDKVGEYEEKMRRMSLDLEDGNRYDRVKPKL
jgi:hypothetical protein